MNYRGKTYSLKKKEILKDTDPTQGLTLIYIVLFLYLGFLSFFPSFWPISSGSSCSHCSKLKLTSFSIDVQDESDS